MDTQTHAAGRGAPPPVDDDYDREEDDEATGEALGGRGIRAEIPAEAMANYRAWRAALEAGEPEALAIYRMIPHADFETVELHMLADAIDGAEDEQAVSRAIFGERYGNAVDLVLTHDWMNMSEEYERAVLRLRLRLEAGCPTNSDRRTVREDALRRIRDSELLALTMPWETEGGSVELSRKIVRGRKAYVCHQTGFPISAGERHLAVRETSEGKVLTTRHSVSAAWCEVVLGDDSLCDALRPEAAPLA